MINFCVSAKELRKALFEIEWAERNCFNHCLAVFDLFKAGRNLDENLCEFEELVEKAHPTNKNLDWGCGQDVTKLNKFVDGKLISITDEEILDEVDKFIGKRNKEKWGKTFGKKRKNT